MTFHIDLRDRKDLSSEIYRQIRRAILEGLLRPKDPLPPTRELARTLAVARATVVVAYERLVAEGLVASVKGSGTLVAEWGRSSVQQRGSRTRQNRLIPCPIWEAIPLPTAFESAAQYDFRTGIPDISLFPHTAWRRLIAQVLRSSERASQVTYDHPAGYKPLRGAIARHIAVSRGVTASADDIVVTNGTQQAVDILARALLVPGDSVAVEDPGYEAPRRALEALGATIVGVPVDRHGLIVEALPTNVKAIYVTPSHQYPLAVTMSLPRRQALLRWADCNNVAVIEDDYDGEFRFEGRPLPPLQTLDVSERVIYVGSFSKSLLPTLRLGFVVPPPSLRAAVQKAKYVSDWHTSTLEQAALARFIEEGSFAKHLRKISPTYRQRHEMITRTIAEEFEGLLELIPSSTGLQVAAVARDASVQQIAEVTERAAFQGVQVHRLSSFDIGGPRRSGLVLGYGAISTALIGEGMRRLRRAFD